MITLNEAQGRQLYIILRMKLDYVICAAKLPHDDGICSIDEANSIMDSLHSIGLFDTSALTGKWLDVQPQKKETELLRAIVESKDCKTTCPTLWNFAERAKEILAKGVASE